MHFFKCREEYNKKIKNNIWKQVEKRMENPLSVGEAIEKTITKVKNCTFIIIILTIITRNALSSVVRARARAHAR
jgi:hypothetical protein